MTVHHACAERGQVSERECVRRDAQPERIVFRHLAPVHEFVATAEFAEQTEGTSIRFTMLFPTAAECAKSKRYVVQGNEENFDRLEAVLGATV